MSSFYRQLRRAPFYPLVPFVPLAAIGTFLVIQALTLARVHKLARSIDRLLNFQTGAQA